MTTDHGAAPRIPVRGDAPSAAASILPSFGDDSGRDRTPSNSKPTHPQRRAIILACVICLVIGALIGALVMAIAHPRADSSAIDNAQTSVRTTAKVSQQPIRTAYQLSGTVTAPQTLAVLPNAPTSANVQAVSGRVRKAGDTINTLDVLGEVSNNPIFAFPKSVPLFRDLVGGDKGSDVSAVQQVLISAGLLSGTPTGVVDTATSRAFDALYHNAGYNPPRAMPAVANSAFAPGAQPVLLLADTASLPSMGLKVVSAAPIGQAIDTDHPLVTLQLTTAQITARVDLLEADAFKQGTEVSVKVGSADAGTSTVLGVSAFSAGDGSTAPGYDVTIGVPSGVDAAASAGQPAIVTEATQPPDGLAVPLLAIRTDSSGTYVYKAADSGADQKVPVTVTGQANGYAILAANSDLPDGTGVVLSGERP